ncbi:MAG: hypothetical protein ACW964_01645 [Candidatus Hodarchaeales archaeon]
MKLLLLIADEPTGNLDFENGTRIINLLHYLRTNDKTTVIQVTHDENMLRLGYRLVQMEDGKIISDHKIPE